jgi:hypothetical protein
MSVREVWNDCEMGDSSFFCFKTLGVLKPANRYGFNKDWEISLAIASAELDVSLVVCDVGATLTITT